MFKILGVAIASFLLSGCLAASIHAPDEKYKAHVKNIWDNLPTNGYILYVDKLDHKVAYAFKNEVHISTGFLDSVSLDEARFVIAHEVSHLIYNHSAKAEFVDKQLARNPLIASGRSFMILGMKFDEQQADLLGMALYRNAGWDMSIFPKLLAREKASECLWSSLSLRDPHFSFCDRFSKIIDSQKELKRCR